MPSARSQLLQRVGLLLGEAPMGEAPPIAA